MPTKTETRMVYVQGRYQGTFEVEVCNICKGHAPVTKDAADGECVGHGGVLNRLLALDDLPQFKVAGKKIDKKRRKRVKNKRKEQ